MNGQDQEDPTKRIGRLKRDDSSHASQDDKEEEADRNSKSKGEKLKEPFSSMPTGHGNTASRRRTGGSDLEYQLSELKAIADALRQDPHLPADEKQRQMSMVYSRRKRVRQNLRTASLEEQCEDLVEQNKQLSAINDKLQSALETFQAHVTEFGNSGTIPDPQETKNVLDSIQPHKPVICPPSNKETAAAAATTSHVLSADNVLQLAIEQRKQEILAYHMRHLSQSNMMATLGGTSAMAGLSPATLSQMMGPRSGSFMSPFHTGSPYGNADLVAQLLRQQQSLAGSSNTNFGMRNNLQLQQQLLSMSIGQLLPQPRLSLPVDEALREILQKQSSQTNGAQQLPPPPLTGTDPASQLLAYLQSLKDNQGR
jgi:hypothetical protein